MKKLGNIYPFKVQAIALSLLAIIISVACSKNEEAESMAEQSDEATKVFFDVHLENYDSQTRSASFSWGDGSCIHLNLQQGSNNIYATIEYNATTDSWKLSQTGSFANGNLTGSAYYFDGNTYKSGNTITLKPETSTYFSNAVECSYASNALHVSAVLKPQMARVRFKGEPASTYKISGSKTNLLYNTTIGVITQNTEPQEITTDTEGYTTPIYAVFGDASRKLVVEYSNLRFSRIYEHPVLDPQKSGCITLPSEASHTGWNMVVKSLPSISIGQATSITTVRAALTATIVDDGNCDITECGFCYSSSVTPTINDMKVVCTPAGKSIKQTISKLSRNTTYHVRAYAINAMGITYSDEITFTTLEGGGDNYGIEDWGEDEDWNI